MQRGKTNEIHFTVYPRDAYPDAQDSLLLATVYDLYHLLHNDFETF